MTRVGLISLLVVFGSLVIGGITPLITIIPEQIARVVNDVCAYAFMVGVVVALICLGGEPAYGGKPIPPQRPV